MGVSVGWDIAQKAEKIHEILEADVIALDTLPVTAAVPVASRSSWFRIMDNIILTKVLGIDLSAPVSEEEKAMKAKELEVAAENIAKSLVCSRGPCWFSEPKQQGMLPWSHKKRSLFVDPHSKSSPWWPSPWESLGRILHSRGRSVVHGCGPRLR